METITKILIEEHKHILKVVIALKKESKKIKSGEKVNPKFFEKAIDFIKNYADKYHHAKEEEILFIELKKDDVQMHCNPMDQMLYEHEQGRDYVKMMVEGLKSNNPDLIMEGADGYSTLLEEHIFKEDNILYPMADDVLTEKAQKMMLKQAQDVAEHKYKGASEKYLKLAEELNKNGA
ncbi:hemerythrin domain-containing protein [Candidatus Woesearchaeota archaeon]|nr:hemerythrin domain-containing protein [Candidatus Woesearchaeota archaeon]